MPHLATALKDEITRQARKEIRSQTAVTKDWPPSIAATWLP